MRCIILMMMAASFWGVGTCSGGYALRAASPMGGTMRHCRKGHLVSGPAASTMLVRLSTPSTNLGSWAAAVAAHGGIALDKEPQAPLPVHGFARRALRQVDSRMAARFKGNKLKADAARRHQQQQQQQQFLAVPK